MGEVIDIIATRILVESQQATKALADFDSATAKATGRVGQLASAIQKLKAETGRTVQDLVKTMQAMNAPKGAGQFGSFGLSNKQIADAGKLVTLYEKQEAAKNKVAVAAERAAAAEAKQKTAAALPQNIIPQFVQKNFGNINDYIAQSSDKIAAWKNVVTGSARAAGVSFEAAGTELKKMVSGTTVAPLNTALKQLGDDGRSAFQKLIDGAHFARIALGALVSMILFQGIQAISTFFQGAIAQARQFEDTLYRLQNAERALSMEGVEITLKGLKKGIADIQKVLPIFAKEDVSQLVGTLAVSTKQLKLNEGQILQLAKAVGILNIRSEKQEDLSTTAQHVLSSLLTGNAKGVTSLGIAFTDNLMRAEAMKQGFLKAGEALTTLTENEKGLVKLGIVLNSTNQELASVDEYLDSNSAKLQENAAAWKDLQTTFGQVLLPFIPALTGFIKLIEDGFNAGKVVLIEFMTMIGTAGVLIKSTFAGNIRSVDDFTNILKASVESLRADLTNTFFKETPDDAPDWFTKAYAPLIKEGAETATVAIDEMIGAAEDTEEAQKALDDLDSKIEDIIVDAKQAREDLKIKLEQKKSDLDLEYNRKTEDAARDHVRKIEDINTDARQKAEDAKRKAREDEKKAERDLLQKLKELRDKFLMDLEDALHERDARQVLRLIREYKMDKQHILERKKLDDQERKDKLAEDLKAIEIERQRKLADEQIDYQRKLADLALQKQREQEELALWYQREQDDIQRNIEQKLEKLLAGYIAEGQLTEENQAAITAILAKHFGNNMALVDQMVAYMQSKFAMMGQMAGGFFGGVGQQGLNIYKASEQGKTAGSSTGTKKKRFAEGGTYLANKPTTVTFGEAGKWEAASFTPLGGGRDVNKLFGDLGGSMGGGLQLGIMLSPELRAEIINTTLDKVAVNIEHVRRERG